jgi:hypothetical protein
VAGVIEGQINKVKKKITCFYSPQKKLSIAGNRQSEGLQLVLETMKGLARAGYRWNL